MNAVLKEVREKREVHGESRKRKRDVESTEACPKAQKQDLPSYHGRIRTQTLRNWQSCAKMSQSSSHP